MTNPTLTLTPRRTLYKGIPMRSRTEALFAERFDNLKLAWEYEPVCFADGTGQYLPDFRITYRSGRRVYVEVKGSCPADLDAVAQRMQIIWSSESEAQLMILIADSGDCFVADQTQWDGWSHHTGNPWMDE